MAGTKIFTNHITNTLFDKFMGIIEKGIEKFGISKDDFVYLASAFNEVFLEDLKYNGLILLLNTQGERDRYLYDRTKYNRKDDGTNRELVLNMLAELSTKDISAATNAQTW